jgi:hypothetical protein
MTRRLARLRTQQENLKPGRVPRFVLSHCACQRAGLRAGVASTNAARRGLSKSLRAMQQSTCSRLAASSNLKKARLCPPGRHIDVIATAHGRARPVAAFSSATTAARGFGCKIGDIMPVALSVQLH